MAQIPGSQGLGEVVARPVRLNETQVPRAAFGSEIAANVAETGAAMVRDEQQQVREWAAEKNRELAQQLAARKAADRAQALTELQFAGDDLAALGDEFANGIKTGQIDKTKAGEEWVTQARERAAAALEKVPADHRPDVQRDLDHRVRRGQMLVGKAVTQRDQQDVRSGIDQNMEAASRMYMTDPKGADALMNGVLDALGPHSGLAPDQVQKLRQTYLENSRYTAGYEAVSRARDNRKALDAADKFIDGLTELDPQKRVQLLDRSAAYKLHLDQKAEVAAARAQRQAEATLKKAEATFTAASALAEKGTLNADYADKVISQLGGTPYADAFRQMVETQRETGPLAAQPLAQLRATVQALDSKIAKEGLTPQLEKMRGRYQHVLTAAEGDYAKDPLPAALERGVIDELVPLDLGNVQTLAASVVGRVAQAEQVQAVTGKPVSPLTGAEADKVGEMLAILPPAERSKAVAALAQQTGPKVASALAAQIDKKDRALGLAFALAGSATTNGRMTSELVLKGAQAKKDGTSTKGEKLPDVKAGQWRARATADLDGVFANQQTTEQIRDAAELIMHGIAAEQGGRLTEKDMDRAVGLALGGTLVEHNGRKVPLPAGVDEDGLNKRLRAVSREELIKQAPTGMVRAGGQEIFLEDFSKSLPAQQLIPVSPGRYGVLVGGRPVTNQAGKPIVIGVQ